MCVCVRARVYPWLQTHTHDTHATPTRMHMLARQNRWMCDLVECKTIMINGERERERSKFNNNKNIQTRRYNARTLHSFSHNFACITGRGSGSVPMAFSSHISGNLGVSVHTCMCVYIHIYMYAYRHICICTYIRIYICAHIHIYMYMYTHTNTHTHSLSLSLLPHQR